MRVQTELSYLQQRVIAANAAAHLAVDKGVRAIHRQFAVAYESRIVAILYNENAKVAPGEGAAGSATVHRARPIWVPKALGSAKAGPAFASAVTLRALNLEGSPVLQMPS